MTIATRMVGTAMLVAMLHGLAASVAAQTAAPERVTLAPEQMEKFLLEAKVVKSRPSGSGTTGTLILTLSDGTRHPRRASAIRQHRAGDLPRPGLHRVQLQGLFRLQHRGLRAGRPAGDSTTCRCPSVGV